MNAFQKNKPFFIFLLKFGGTYLLLSVIYSLYLGGYDSDKFEADGMTQLVARQSAAMAEFFGKEAHTEAHKTEASYKFFLEGKYLSRVVEGCNALSVMILFAAFIVAFSSSFKRTGIYIITGVIVIHILNIVRIALLNIALYSYKEYGDLLHDIVFPLFIYGVVVILWIAWVAKFRGNAKK
jgi:exosortase family protein XrtF